MTNTTIVNAVSVGTDSNIGAFFNPVKTALQAATSAVQISVKFTGTAQTNLTSRIRAWQQVSPNSYATATAGALALSPGATYVPITLSTQASTDIEMLSDLIVCASGYHYLWFDIPVMPSAGTITVILQELP